MIRGHSALLLLSVLATAALPGCAMPTSLGSTRCPMPDQKAMTIARLYFGRDIAGHAPVSDNEWDGFARSVLTPQLPDGFTAFKGSGQWLDPDTRQVVREDSIVVEIAAEPGPDFTRRIDTVVEAYRRQFHQQAVGVVTEAACGHF